MKATSPPGVGGFKFVDLFAGIGGFHLALGGRWDGLGGDCVLTSELDREARRVYRSNFGGPVKGDLRKIIARSKGADVWQDDPEDDILLGPSELPAHDVLAAGFPCQPFSKSGAQQGLRDSTRGTLFFDIASMLERPDPPRFLCLENVRNLASHDGGRTWQIIVQRLQELGYDVSAEPLVFSPHLLPPELGGAPQFRERVFVLAQHRDFRTSAEAWDFHIPNKPVGDWRPQKDWDLAEWLLAHPALEADLDPYVWREQRRKRALAWAELLCDLPAGRVPQPLQEYSWRFTPETEGLPRWKQRHNEINSAFYREHQPLLDAWRRRHRPETWNMSDRKLEWQAQDAVRVEPKDVLDLQIQFRPSGLRVKRPTYTGALVAITQTPYMGWLGRSLTPSEAATLQGLPVHDPVDPYVLHPTPATAYKQLGNGVNAGVVRYLMRSLFDYTGYSGTSSSADDASASVPMPDATPLSA